MEIVAAESTNLFIGSEGVAAPGRPGRPARDRNRPRASPRPDRGRAPADRGTGHARTARARGGSAARDRGRRRRRARGRAARCRDRGRGGNATERLPFQFAVAEPGWRMFMISHFHYDPVWWNTQAAYTETWGAAIQYRSPFQEPGFALVKAHLDMARRDPTTSSCSPSSTTSSRTGTPIPEDRDYIRQLLADGSAGVRGRDVQRAEHQPHERGIDDPQRDLRDRLPARRPRRCAGHRVAARRLRSRPAVPRDHGRRRRHLELVGTRAVPRVGPELGPRSRPAALRRAGGRRADRGCSSRWSSTGSRRAAAPC